MADRFVENYRELTPTERQLLERLLGAEFTGRDEIAEQVKTCKVRAVDEHGCLEFFVQSETKAPVRQGVPIEAEAEDEDGIVIHMLLHVVDGKVKELEFYSESNSPIKRIPDPSEWRLI